MSMPFDNLSIFDAPDVTLSRAYIIEKILTKGQGGLCYELNTLLNIVMEECGLTASLVVGTIYDNLEQKWFAFPNTHALNIIERDGQLWLVDIGFGLKSPRQMVPLDGKVVEYGGCKYRIVQEGSYYYLNYQQSEVAEWSIGYRFAVNYQHVSIEELENNRRIITFEEASPFNKTPMSAIFTVTGHEVITPSGYTITRDRVKMKVSLTEAQFNALVKERSCPIVI